MKEFINAIKCTIICQLLCWGIFIICDENKYISQSAAEVQAMISGIIILILLLTIYFIYSGRYIKNNNMNSKKFNIMLFSLWSASSILITCGLCSLVDNGILHVCRQSGWWPCFLSGIEYGLEGIFMIALVILILCIKIIIVLYKYITKNKKK